MFQSLGDLHGLRVSMYAAVPRRSSLYFTLGVMWVLAVFVIIVGGYWAVRVRYQMYAPCSLALTLVIPVNKFLYTTYMYIYRIDKFIEKFMFANLC